MTACSKCGQKVEMTTKEKWISGGKAKVTVCPNCGNEVIVEWLIMPRTRKVHPEPSGDQLPLPLRS